tara:strand:+ start:73436 stop:73858 length:423 start_codon:yes stop_codon:yes gene_type:complete
MDEAEMTAAIEVLKTEREADRFFMLGLAAAVARANLTGEAIDVMKALEASVVYATAVKGSTIGAAVANNLQLLRPMVENADPIEFMTVASLSLLDAGEEHRNARLSWWQQATPDEIAEELRSLFERFAEGVNRDDERPDE